MEYANYEKIFEDAVNAGTVENIVPKITKWEAPEQCVIGKLLSIDVVNDNDRDFNKYLMEGSKGLFSVHLGKKYDNIIDNNMIGKVLKIVYKGVSVLKNGYKANEFEITKADVKPDAFKRGI